MGGVDVVRNVSADHLPSFCAFRAASINPSSHAW
jgi:hypothetical protein